MINNYFKVAGNTEIRIRSELFFFDDKDKDSIEIAYDRALENLRKRRDEKREGQLSVSVFSAFKTTSKARGIPLVGFDGPYTIRSASAGDGLGFVEAIAERTRRVEANRRLANEWATA